MTSPTLSVRPMVIAHRGASGYLPEHTLAAKAMAHAMGADYIEQDVVLSRDGVPVILHDVYLESTTDVARRFPGRARADGRFYAMDFALDELRQLRVHERSSTGESGEELAVYPDRFPLGPALFGIPTLAEEIDLIAGLDRSRGCRTGLYVELKGPNLHLQAGMDIAEIVLRVLAEKGYGERPEQVFLQCFDGATLRRLRHEIKTPLPLIQLIGENSWGEDTTTDYDYLRSPEGLAEIAGYADGIGPWLNQIYLGKDHSGEVQLSNLVADARQHGLLVHPYTFRRDELPMGIDSFDELLDIFFRRAGVNGVFTDFPDLVAHYLQQSGGTGILNYDAARLYLLARPEAREDFPFGPDTAVMKIGGKMFATLGRTDGAASMNLKCDPDEAVMLRDIFDAVRPGYHMNKRHWNTVILDGSIPRGEIERMIDNSFSLVVKGLPRAERQALEIRHGKGALYPQHNTGSTSG